MNATALQFPVSPGMSIKNAVAEAATKRAEDARLIAKGKELAKTLLPAGCERVIVATLKKDDSDSHSDYFGQKTLGLVVLAASACTRDSFSEMRKAAKRFKPTADMVLIEHREKYSMGKGYYLSGSDISTASGWEISKRYLCDQAYKSLAVLHCLPVRAEVAER